MGNFRHNSDIDLAFYGAEDAWFLAELLGDYEESLLPYQLDALSYNHITEPALQAHIDAVGLPLQL
jgi:hypothetical protein